MGTGVGTGFVILYYVLVIDSIILLVAMLKHSIKKHQYQGFGRTMKVNLVFISAVVILIELMIVLLTRGVP